MKAYIIASLLVLVLAGAIWLVAGRHTSIAPIPANSAPATSTSASEMPDGWKTYSNPRFHFALAYPPELSVNDTVQDGALTVVFQATSSGEGFQIYAFPYNEPQISAARFKADEPSGVMNDPTDIVIDGTRGTMFFGRDATLGDTREVWFIHGGVLYEVATYKALDEWLAGIMRTWHFL